MRDERAVTRRSGRTLFLIAIVVLGILVLAVLANAFGIGPWGGAGSQPDVIIEQPAEPGASPRTTVEVDEP